MNDDTSSAADVAPSRHFESFEVAGQRAQRYSDVRNMLRQAALERQRRGSAPVSQVVYSEAPNVGSPDLETQSESSASEIPPPI